jgi:hypothetical protein
MIRANSPNKIAEARLVTPTPLFRLGLGAPRFCWGRRTARIGARCAIVVGGLAENDLVEIPPVVGPGKYAAIEFVNGIARLLRFERDLIKVLTPYRPGLRLDLTDVSILRLRLREPLP